jgi:hypothetical protein
MPNPWEKYAAQQDGGPWSKYQSATQSFASNQPPAPGSQEVSDSITSLPGEVAHKIGVAARPWGPFGAALTIGAGGGAIAGIPGGPGGMLAGAGAGIPIAAAAYGGAHLADLPVMAVNGIGGLFGYNPGIPYPGATFDEFVNNHLNPLPEPETTADKYLAATSGGIKDAVAGNRVGKFMEAGQALGPVFQKIGTAMSDAPGKNMVMGGAGGAGAQFGGDATDGSTVGKIAGAILPVAAIGSTTGLARRLVNSSGGPSTWQAYGRGFMGRGEDVVMQNGETIPATWGFTGARLENARQTAENQVQDQLQNTISKAGGSVADVVSELDKSGNLSGEGFNPTAGAASKNQGLTMVENGLYQSDPAMRARYENNMRAVSGSVNNAVQPVGAPIQESQGFFTRFLSNQARAAERNAQRFDDIDMNRANQNLAQKQAEVTSSASSDQQTGASIAARKQAGNMMNDEQAAYRKLYAAVPRDTPIEFNNSIEKGVEALKEHGANAAVDPSISAARSRIETMIKARSAEPVTNFGEIESDLKIVNSLIKQASNAGQDQAVRLYSMFKEGIVADIEAGGAASPALKQANGAFRTFKERWSNGVAGDALDKNSLPSETLNKYMASPEGATQYSQTVGTTPVGKESASRYLSASVARASGQNPTSQSVTAAINKNPAISTFPEVRAAQEAKATQIGAATKMQANRQGQLEQMQADAAAAQKKATTSLPAKYAKGSEDSAVSAIETALGSNDSTSAINELIKTAKADRSGKSMEGLKNAARKYLSQKLFNKTNAAAKNEVSAVTNEDLPTSMAKMGDVLNEDGTIMKNMRKLLTPEEIQTLQTNYRRLEMGTRIRKAGLGGSATAPNESDKAVLENLVKGYTNINAFRTIKTAKTMLQDLKTIAGSAFTNSRVNDIINDTRLQAFLDPDKMKQLLLRPTPQNWERTSWARQQMNILAQEINSKPDESSDTLPKSTPAAQPKATPAATPAAKSSSKRMRWNPDTGKLEPIAATGQSNRDVYPDLYT